MRLARISIVAVLLGTALGEAAGATLRGTVAYHGPPPAFAPLEVDHDRECCAKSRILPETLLVSAQGGVRNAVVWLEGVKGDATWPAAAAALDQEKCVFLPHVLVVGVGRPVRFLNSDPIIHNVHSWPRANEPMSVSQLAKGLGRAIERTFDAPDEIKITCDVHRWMSAWIVVRDTPYYALTGEDGAFEIRSVPPGTYTLVVWHESLERIERPVTLEGSAVREVTLELQAK